MPATEKYTVKKGDTLIKIAKTHYIADWKKEIWAAPFNKELRSKTKNPDKIEPGWIVQLPVIKPAKGDVYGTVGGAKGLNRPDDIKTVQVLLNKHAQAAGFKPLTVNGKSDKALNDAIKAFQASAGLSVTGTIGPKDKTLGALAKAPPKGGGSGKTEYKIAGKTYQADAEDVKKANQKVSERLLKAVGFMEEHLNSLAAEQDKIARGWSDGAPFVRAALRLSLNGGMMRDTDVAINRARAEVAKLRKMAGTTDSAKLKRAVEHRMAAQKAVNEAGGAFTKMIQASGASLEVWLDVMIFTRDTSFGIIEVYLAAVTKNPPAAGAAVSGFKQGVEELSNAAFFNEKWQNTGGVKGAVCRVAAKGAEGAVFGQLGKWVGQAAKPFAGKMGTWIAKSGLLKSVAKTQSKTIRQIVLKKYSKALMKQFPKLVEKDIADWMIEKAVDVSWNAGAPHVAAYWVEWLKDYHYKLCDMIVKDENDFKAAMKRAEDAAKSPKEAEPLVRKHIELKKDEIARLVAEELKKSQPK